MGDLLAIAAATEITFPEAEQMKAYLADPTAFASAAPAATEEAPKEEAARLKRKKKRNLMTTWDLDCSTNYDATTAVSSSPANNCHNRCVLQLMIECTPCDRCWLLRITCLRLVLL